MTHPLFLAEINKDIRANPLHVRLALDPGSDIDETNKPLDEFLADFLKNEIRQTTDGYAPQAYTPSSSAYDSVTGRDNLEQEILSFVESSGGSGYSFNRVVLWYKGTATANKPIISVDTGANTISVTSHGLVAGQRVYLRSSAGGGGLPGGTNDTTIYYAGNIATSTLSLYTDEALTSIVDLTSSGTGTLDLCWADGVPLAVISVSSVTINPSGTQPIVVQPFAKSAA